MYMWTPSDWYLSLGPDAPLEYEARMIDFLAGRVPDWRHERLRAIEALASRHYRGRVERPDGSCAREPTEKRRYLQEAKDPESLDRTGLSRASGPARGR